MSALYEVEGCGTDKVVLAADTEAAAVAVVGVAVTWRGSGNGPRAIAEYETDDDSHDRIVVHRVSDEVAAFAADPAADPETDFAEGEVWDADDIRAAAAVRRAAVQP